VRDLSLQEAGMSWRESVIQVALGKKRADLVIKGGKLVNVSTREVYRADVAIADGRVAVVGDVSACTGRGTKIVRAYGCYLLPGFIDSHVHTEDSQVTLTELSRALLPHGVTAVLHAHEAVNILGLRGQDMIRDEIHRIPLKVYIQAPPSVPWAAGLETTGAAISVEDVTEMLSWRETASLGESDVYDILKLDEHILAKLDAAAAAQKPVNGHAAMVKGERLMAVAAGAFHDDHENYTPDELMTKVRLGLRVMLREFNIPVLAPAVAQGSVDTRNMLLATDDKPIHWIVKKGGVDQALRQAIEYGIDPVTAIQMATINPATYYRLDLEIGSISPGRIADVVITRSLKKPKAVSVIANGQLVVRWGRFLPDLPPYRYPDWAKGTIHLSRRLEPSDFEIKPGFEAGEVEVNVVKISEGGFVRALEPQSFPVKGGKLVL
jgi:adenine deaminase